MTRNSGGNGRHLAFLLDRLHGGGVQKLWPLLAGAFAERGHTVDLLLGEPAAGPPAPAPPGVRLVALPRAPAWRAAAAAWPAVRPEPALRPYLWLGARQSPTFGALPALVAHLRQSRPEALLTATPFMNVEAGLALRLAGVPTRHLASEHNHVTADHPFARGLAGRLLPGALRATYARAQAVVAVSEGVAADMARRAALPAGRVRTIYNPAGPPDIAARAAEPLDHPWLAPGAPPVVLGMGRLSPAKDFPTLIRAVALARRQRHLRLVILGERLRPEKTARRQAELMALARDLGIGDDVLLPGHVPNPYAWLARAALFALSSVNEGFSIAVAEALAVGCPVVATDCPSGPAEILEGGRHGALVPMRDPEAMAAAILRTLAHPPDPAALRARAALFTLARAVDQWEALVAS